MPPPYPPLQWFLTSAPVDSYPPHRWILSAAHRADDLQPIPIVKDGRRVRAPRGHFAIHRDRRELALHREMVEEPGDRETVGNFQRVTVDRDLHRIKNTTAAPVRGRP